MGKRHNSRGAKLVLEAGKAQKGLHQSKPRSERCKKLTSIKINANDDTVPLLRSLMPRACAHAFKHKPRTRSLQSVALGGQNWCSPIQQGPQTRDLWLTRLGVLEAKLLSHEHRYFLWRQLCLTKQICLARKSNTLSFEIPFQLDGVSPTKIDSCWRGPEDRNPRVGTERGNIPE